jgi:hypothetical protein
MVSSTPMAKTLSIMAPMVPRLFLPAAPTPML